MTRKRINEESTLSNSEIQSNYQRRLRISGAIRMTGYLKEQEEIDMFNAYKKKSGLKSKQAVVESIIKDVLSNL